MLSLLPAAAEPPEATPCGDVGKLCRLGALAEPADGPAAPDADGRAGGDAADLWAAARMSLYKLRPPCALQ